MGRYYSNQEGESGKFWFAVQPSDDPQTIYGMDEDEECDYAVDYWTDDDEYVRFKLYEQYDILGVPKDKRKYEFETMEEMGKYVWEELESYFLTNKKSEDPSVIAYGMYDNDEHKTMYPISKEKELAASRVQLGLFILNTIRKYGECSLNAEL